jgi:hypothetical protein
MLQMPTSSNCVFSFWIGMPYDTQYHIIELCAVCSSINTIAVFKDEKWPTPKDGTLLAPPLTVLALMLLFGSSAGRARGGWKCWLGAGEGSANQNVCFAPDKPGVDLPTQLN